jgi:hypothetical protein
LADDVRWTIIGTTAWSGIYEGTRAVVAELLASLAEQFTGANIVSAGRFVAEGIHRLDSPSLGTTTGTPSSAAKDGPTSLAPSLRDAHSV